MKMHEKYKQIHGKSVYKLGPASQRAAGVFFPKKKNTFQDFVNVWAFFL